jgi:nanoRNase/pAp phosphatase (c-di-AMP/oligoRNAs hydrolase)
MEELNQATKIISQSDNILIIGPKSPDFDELISSYSLSYTLNKSGKLVNHCFKKLPGNYPQVFNPTALPKTFVITINSDDISQFYYEKQKKLLKIFLTTKEKFVDEKDIKISPVQATQLEKCDLIITVGLKNLELLGELYDKNFKLFYQTPILNIDNKESNNRFGNFNLINEDQPIAVILNKLIRAANYKLDKKSKLWLLLGIIDFLKNKEPDQTTLKTIFDLISIEVDFEKMVDSLYQEKEAGLLVQAFKSMEFFKDTAIVSFRKEYFKNSNSKSKNLKFVLEKLTKETFRFPKLLVLWQDNLFVKGVFYSKNEHLLDEFSDKFTGQKKGKGIIFETKFRDTQLAKKEIKQLI